MGLADVVARFFSLHGPVDVSAEFGVTFAGAHVAIEIVLHLRKKAGADLAVGGESNTAARTAEGLCDGRDDADFAAAIGKGVAARGFAGFARRHRDERQYAADAIDNLRERNDDFRCPQATLFERHELDEADDHIFLAGKMGEALDLFVVEAAQEHAVDLERGEAGLACGTDAGEHLVKTARHTGDSFEGRGIYRIHADRYAMEARSLERSGELIEQVAVGGESEIERLAL
jgi:hypothetical protein